MKTINVTEETKKRLSNIGRIDETYDDLVNRLADEAGYDREGDA